MNNAVSAQALFEGFKNALDKDEALVLLDDQIRSCLISGRNDILSDAIGLVGEQTTAGYALHDLFCVVASHPKLRANKTAPLKSGVMFVLPISLYSHRSRRLEITHIPDVSGVALRMAEKGLVPRLPALSNYLYTLGELDAPLSNIYALGMTLLAFSQGLPVSEWHMLQEGVTAGRLGDRQISGRVACHTRYLVGVAPIFDGEETVLTPERLAAGTNGFKEAAKAALDGVLRTAYGNVQTVTGEPSILPYCFVEGTCMDVLNQMQETENQAKSKAVRADMSVYLARNNDTTDIGFSNMRTGLPLSSQSVKIRLAPGHIDEVIDRLRTYYEKADYPFVNVIAVKGA